MKDMVVKAGLTGEILVESKACRTDEIGSDMHPGTKRVLRA
ncbi:protein-tyrosine phosphatase [Selenomonas ruminantium]|uniref:Protein-tyrosine phosphatase n=1 Tax=Selenomonas ruminantium TaxID=971 RepID=A0A1I3EIR5_SELRU|nr:protein-tyrosine phosphatase [Selenomonas ruminantium]